MTRKFNLVVAAIIIVAPLTVASGQRPGDGRRGPPGRGFSFSMPPGFHLMTALDADRDGKISSDEMANATAVLSKLDQDGDGKLSPQEIGWPPNGFGGGRGGFGGFGGSAPAKPRRPDPDGDHQ